MPTIIGTNQVKTADGKVQPLQEGAWYDGQRYLGGKFLAPGQDQPGHTVSSAVNQQSDVAQGLAPGSIDAYLARLRGQSAPALPAAGTPAPTTGGGIGATGGGTLSLGGTTTTNANGGMNLQGIFDQAYKDAGIADLGTKANSILDEINKRKTDQAAAEASINEDPFYVEAKRVGKIQKLRDQVNNDIAALTGQYNAITNQIQSKKSEIDTRLNLATKQFDINQSVQKQAMDQFNALLSAGALGNANENDLAQFATATGLPISFLTSAVKANKAKNIDSQLIQSTDNNGNVTVAVVDKNTGKVISKTSLGAVGTSKTIPAGEKIAQARSNIVQFLDAKKNDYGHVGKADWDAARSAYIQDGGTAQDFNSTFASYTDPYNQNFPATYGFDIKSRGASQYQILSQQ